MPQGLIPLCTATNMGLTSYLNPFAWGSSSPASTTDKKAEEVRSGTRAPDRTERKRCWEARDAYFACLDRNRILDALKDEKKAAAACGSESVGFEKDCAREWVSYHSSSLSPSISFFLCVFPPPPSFILCRSSFSLVVDGAHSLISAPSLPRNHRFHTSKSGAWQTTRRSSVSRRSRPRAPRPWR